MQVQRCIFKPDVKNGFVIQNAMNAHFDRVGNNCFLYFVFTRNTKVFEFFLGLHRE